MKQNGGDYEKGNKISECSFSNCFIEPSASDIGRPAFDQGIVLLRLLIVGN